MSIKAAEWYVRNKRKIMLAIFFFAVILIISIIVGILGRINSEEQANNIELPNWFGPEISNKLTNSDMATKPIEKIFE